MEDKAMFRILDILYSYGRQNKILDEIAIREIIYGYLKDNGLSGLINDVIFCDLRDRKIYAVYDNIKTRIIYFDLNAIKNAVYERHYTHVHYINCVNLINQWLVISVLHEINHAIRFNTIHSKFDVVDIIVKKVRSLSLGTKGLYDKFHDYFPSEKEANVFAYERTIWLYQQLNSSINDINGLNNLYIGFLKTIIDGYEENSFLNNPLKKVMLSTDEKDILKMGRYIIVDKAIELKNMSLYERLTFGFPITLDEYYFIKELLDNVMMYSQSEYLDIKGIILSNR